MLARVLLVVLGLVAGVVAAVLVFGALYALIPPPDVRPASPSLTATSSPNPDDGDGSGSPTVTSSPAAPPPSATGAPPSASASGDAAFGIGDPAPALQVTTLDGETIDLAELRGWPVWVNFMATWCPPCGDELPLMNGFATRYADTGLVVLAVDVQEERSAVAAFMESLGVTFPVGLDPNGTAQATWGAYALPIHFWVDASGIVRDGALGGIGPDVMAAGLRTILPGVDVQP